MSKKFRVTYATLGADNEELHRGYEDGVHQARGWLGRELRGHVADPAATAPLTAVTSPHDPSIVVSQVRESTPNDIDSGIGLAAKSARGWAAKPWRERMQVMLRVADLISERSNELGALMSIENGKNRLEALGDVEEAADMIRYYCNELEKHDGYDHPMGSLNPAERTRSVLKPYGVWAVVGPFNFPMALTAGPAGAALVAGNTVVVKPSLQGTFIASKLFECFTDAGVPAEAAILLPGGDDVGQAVVADPRIGGVTFTGSSKVGMSIFNEFATQYPKPVMAEMGGKNPTIVSAKADLDDAALGVARSAFGFSGQKCSACSRVYVQREVRDEFLAKLVEQTKKLKIGDPTARDSFVGPVVDADAVRRFEEAVAHAREVGTVVTGGEALNGEGLPGHYVAPTVVTDLPLDDHLYSTELFVPFVAVATVDTVQEGLELSNADPAGLTAGFFSTDQAEIDEFLEVIEAGVIYVNRPAGATTGAWPGVQPFGGWKRSGSTGKAGGGLYYLPEFLREQSQTVVEK